MSVVDHARERILAGADVTSAVREATANREPPWQALIQVLAEVHGAGQAIQPLLDDPAVTDVLINGDDDVWIDAGKGLRKVLNTVDARALALRLATLAGKRLDNAAPIVDGRLPDGTRLHAVLPPLVHGSAHISLRRQARHRIGWEELRSAGFLTPEFAEVIDQLIRTRANLLVSGAGGAGKTTLVAAALGRVPPQERIVIIEEAVELMPAHPHLVHLQSRTANVQGVGGIGLASLVRAAMRMRPDRLVLGECRGKEVREMLSGFNTGHDGGWATIHANTAEDVPARLVALGALAHMEPRTVELQAQAGLDAVIHVQRRCGVRGVDHIGVASKAGPIAVRTARECDPKSREESARGPGWTDLAGKLGQGIGGWGGSSCACPPWRRCGCGRRPRRGAPRASSDNAAPGGPGPHPVCESASGIGADSNEGMSGTRPRGSARRSPPWRRACGPGSPRQKPGGPRPNSCPPGPPRSWRPSRAAPPQIPARAPEPAAVRPAAPCVPRRRLPRSPTTSGPNSRPCWKHAPLGSKSPRGPRRNEPPPSPRPGQRRSSCSRCPWRGSSSARSWAPRRSACSYPASGAPYSSSPPGRSSSSAGSGSSGFCCGQRTLNRERHDRAHHRAPHRRGMGPHPTAAGTSIVVPSRHSPPAPRDRPRGHL